MIHPCWTKKQWEQGEDEACVQRSTSDFDMRLASPRLRPFPRVSRSSPPRRVATCTIGMIAPYAARKTWPGGGCLYDASHPVLVLFARQVRHSQSHWELVYGRVVPTRVMPRSGCCPNLFSSPYVFAKGVGIPCSETGQQLGPYSG